MYAHALVKPTFVYLACITTVIDSYRKTSPSVCFVHHTCNYTLIGKLERVEATLFNI